MASASTPAESMASAIASDVATFRPEEREAIATAKSLAESVLAANAERYDRDAQFPKENFDALRSNDLIGVTVPREHGGRGVAWPAYVVFLKELATGCASTAVSFHMHIVSMAFINQLGTEEQKDMYFAEALGGALFGSWGAEPTTSWAGKVALSTGYRFSGGRMLLSGTKYFCSLGAGARYGLVFAVSKDKMAQANRDDVQILIIDTERDEVKIGSDWNPMGMRATASQRVQLDDYTVPPDAKLGQPGDMARVPTELVYALGYAAVYQGVAEAAHDWAVTYAQGRRVQPSNEPIATFDRIQRKVAEMTLSIQSGALALARAAHLVEHGLGDHQATLSAVLAARALTTRAVLTSTGLALEVVGGPGVARGNPLERFHRDGRTGVLMVPGIDQCLENLGKHALGFAISEFA